MLAATSPEVGISPPIDPDSISVSRQNDSVLPFRTQTFDQGC